MIPGNSAGDFFCGSKSYSNRLIPTVIDLSKKLDFLVFFNFQTEIG